MSYLYQKSTSQNQVGQFFSTLSNGYANMYISSEKNVEFKNQSLKVQKFHQELSGAKRGSHPIDRLSHAFSFFVIKLPFRCTRKCKPKPWYCGCTSQWNNTIVSNYVKFKDVIFVPHFIPHCTWCTSLWSTSILT